ncbi:hypothetical protein SprV_0902717700 [Sparganum proliferum]
MHTTTDLQHIFGRQTLILTRRWEKFAQRQAATFEQLTFLHRCRDHDVLPKSLRFKPTLPNENGRFLACKYGWRVLSAIISDVHNRLRRFEAILADLKNQCASALPENVLNNVQQRINATTKDARLKKRVDLQEKLQSLLRPTNERSMTTRVVNLSKRILSPAEISLLSKGIGFNHTDATPTNFLAGLESVLLASALPEDKRADIRSCATGILRQKRRQQTLPADEAQGLQSLKSDHNIVVVPADKGGATVIMDRIDYVNKANEIFSDVAAYTPLAEDPTKKQAAAIKKKVTELARLKVISPDDSKLMTLSDPHIARAYGLPKVHKVDVPLRIIVPLIGSPTYNIAKWLYRHLKQLTHGSDYSINNSHAFLQRIQGLKCASALPENVFNNVQQRINATTKDARLKKRVDLQEKLQSLLRPTNERSMTTRVVNLSKRILSPAEISLLSKGIGFNHTDATPTNFLAGLESVLLASALPEDKRADIRSCATGILRQKRRQQTLPADEAQGLQSLKSDHNIVVVPADKGGATVIMDRIDYVNKANEIFSDVAAYTPLAEDPTKKQAAAIKKKVTELARLKVISPDDSKLMTLSDPHIARAYGLPKVHKVDVPLRIIVPLIGSPTYNIAKWLYRHLKQLTHGSDYSINNSHAFLQRIQGLKVEAWAPVLRNTNWLSVRRDPLSLVFAHALECDHRFNWDGTEVVAMANTKRAREFLEAWYSNAGSINRHVDLDAHYEGLRSRLTAPCPNHASTTANTEARSPTDSPPTLPLQHSVP